MFYQKNNKIETGIIPVPLPMHKAHSSNDFIVNCKYFNKVCDYNRPNKTDGLKCCLSDPYKTYNMFKKITMFIVLTTTW